MPIDIHLYRDSIQITTPELPNVYLTETESSIYQSEDITPLWTLWGNRKNIFESLKHNQEQPI
ncbi:hypothetical protein ACXYTD_07935 [Staphylococcus hominis]|uniref:hypothetical protein n=1 Tax=Staphylococcus TaxID=1279 RepID=UPI00066B6B4C|nr:hypothetical protein [Staphylococcus hominis]PTK34085.1 hypothetical protein BUZ47_01195 [Staphylococcus hominis]